MRLYDLIEVVKQVNTEFNGYKSEDKNNLVYVKEKREFYKIKKIYTSCDYCHQRKNSHSEEQLCREYVLESCDNKKFCLLCAPRYEFKLVKLTKKEKLTYLLTQNYYTLTGEYN